MKSSKAEKKPIAKSNIGNFSEYYKYRSDNRVSILKDFIKDKRVLDIGCNTGKLTVDLAKDAAFMLGIDIDKNLIKKAWNHLSLEFSVMAPFSFEKRYPKSFPFTIGSVPISGKLRNCKFKTMDILEQKLDTQFDVILCLSVTKWIHLQKGDQGVLLLFRKIKKLLSPHGLLILEPQRFTSYSKQVSKNQSKMIDAFEILPENFPQILKEMGFLFCNKIVTGEGSFERDLLFFKIENE